MDPTVPRHSVNPRVLVGKIFVVNGAAFGAVSLLLGGITLLFQPGMASTHGPIKVPVTGLLALIFAGIGLVEGLVGLILWLLPGGESPTAQVVNRYYAALESRDYTAAFHELDLSLGAPFGPAITQDDFVAKARAYDSDHGSVVNYALVGTRVQPSFRVYIIKVMRLGDGSYRTRLRLAKRAGEWKIVGFDRF